MDRIVFNLYPGVELVINPVGTTGQVVITCKPDCCPTVTVRTTRDGITTIYNFPTTLHFADASAAIALEEKTS